ncbi:hypothetical protein DICVIV_01447 [Dictyocaulus viviparus]|uniref:Uncharacterized protein n=1 Tax=Dictyocaulus viviparus TaxID=29172 RepID=A0A0D8Y6K3_DICVI|nr:hypothetical protein DICVIV_01447 [Dictyocaulus viviparus]
MFAYIAVEFPKHVCTVHEDFQFIFCWPKGLRNMYYSDIYKQTDGTSLVGAELFRKFFAKLMKLHKDLLTKPGYGGGGSQCRDRKKNSAKRV